MAGVVYPGVEGFRTAEAVQLNIIPEHPGNLLPLEFRGLGEGLGRPLPHILGGAVRIAGAPTVKIIGQGHKVGQGHLVELQIPHVDNPQLPDAIVPGLGHGLPGLGQGGGIHPFVGDGAAVVVEMVVHAPAAGVIHQVPGGHGTQMAVVILAEQEQHILQLRPVLQARGGLVPIKIGLHLLVQGQKLGRPAGNMGLD